VILTSERPRLRWLALVSAWAVVAVFAVLHALAFRDYISLLSRAGPRTPPIETPLQRIAPTNYADAQMWVRYALDFDQGGPWRTRQTDKDNAPHGRDVHWNSAFAHYVAAGGKAQAAVTGESLARATERSLAWLNLPLLLGTIVFFSVWISRRAGAGAGVLVALGILGTEAFYAGFSPNYVDHHGILTAAAFGLVLGAIFMGAGWWRDGDDDEGQLLPTSRTQARQAAIFSALCGAVGLWFSAASTIPAIGLVGGAGLLAVWFCGRTTQQNGATFDPGLWRLWGRVGAAASVGFYLLEYFPSHLGLRLEVNHPCYALAWWGGAELVALFGAQRLAGTGFWPSPRWRLAAPLVALALAPITILFGGVRVFVISDAFGGSNYSGIVAEGLSLFAMQKIFGWQTFFNYAGWNLLPLPVAAWLLCRRKNRHRARLTLVFASLVALGFVVLLFSQVRWSFGASGPLLCLLLVATAAALHGHTMRTRWLVIGALAGVFFLPQTLQRISAARANVAARQADRMDLQQILYRDAAAAIRASQPAGDIVLLASPNGSSGIGYYGQFKTIGTLYWENYAGMRAAAEIFSAPDDETAFKLVRARGITHLAMISEENFLPQFFSILHPDRSAEDLKRTFGYKVLAEQVLPRWLRPIPYRAPPDVSLPNLRVLLLQVVPEQSDTEAIFHIARAQLALGESESAAQSFVAAANRAPAESRATVLLNAGNACYQNGGHLAAAKLYRLALTLGENPVVTTNFAWLLATSRDDNVRNGIEALSLAEPLARAYPNDPSTLGTLAAALAENGRFGEAVTAAARALERVAPGENTATLAELTARLDAYRAGRPWRR